LLFIKHLNIVGVVFLLGHYYEVMNSPSLQIPSFKISIAAMFVATLGFSHSTAEAVIIVGPDGENCYVDEVYKGKSDLSTYYEALDGLSKKELPGTTFLTTSRSSTIQGSSVITGYNDAGGDSINNTDTTSSSSLTLAQAGYLTHNNDDDKYVRFLLSANQKGSPGDNYYKVQELKIYTSEHEQFSLTSLSACLAYKFKATEETGNGSDETGNGALALQYTTGNSNWDVALYVPYENFQNGALSAAETYIHFVVRYEDNAGFDTWSVAECDTLVPEPSSALLVSLGGLIGLLRRRR
jgi:hypothetical protein